MARKGENIYKRKDGRWEGRYIKAYIGKKAKYGYVYGKKYYEVKKKLTELKANTAIQTVSKTNEKADISFFTISETWLEICSASCKNSTIMKYRNIVEIYLKPYLGEYSISKISSEDITKMCKDLSSNGGRNKTGLAPKTIADTISVLRSIRLYAITENYPVNFEIKTLKYKKVEKPLRIFDQNEQKKLSDYLIQNQSMVHTGILFCLYTGIRIGELCALKWEDISFETCTVYIHKTMFRLQTKAEKKKTKIFISTPKSESSIRTIPLPEYIMNILSAYQKEPESYFLTGHKETFIEPRTIQYRFKKILQKCGIADANFHALRHTFATRCVEAGFDIKSLSEILGHSGVNITLNRYVHPSMELKRTNMNKLAEFLAVK